ncbi:MAG: acetyltransferase [Candidatus Electrothrix sp. AR4]|nr:acetyltransferase [Candidatus Electrothrix sp. AR4]
MKYIDVFNGDADGICALHQLRLHEPRPDARLLSGVKRDISLLEQLLEVNNSLITVLDISLDRNRDSLETILSGSNTILYVDHHYAGSIPDSNQLAAHINPDPLTCTSLIINQLLENKYFLWAIVGAFGDNLDESALRLANQSGLTRSTIDQLKEIGILLNYNGYGASEEDLFFHPIELFRQVQPYADPLDFYADSSALRILQKGYQDDMDKAMSFAPVHQDRAGRIFQLPAEPWSRRVAGVYSNTLARQQPKLAHVLLTENNDGSLRISVRAPLENRNGADALCRQFPTGGGRAAAAGVNALPAKQLDDFIKAFSDQFSSSIPA